MAKKEHNDLMKFLIAAYLMENAFAYWLVSTNSLGNKWGKTVRTYDLVIDDMYISTLKPEASYLPEFRPVFRAVPTKKIHKVMGISESTFKKFREAGLMESVSVNNSVLYKYKMKEKIFTPFYLIHSGRV